MKQLNWLINPVRDQYADFSGRTTREQFWMYVLWYIIVYVILSVIADVTIITFPVFIFGLGLIIPSLAIGARRLHDVGKSGWWQLLALIPVLGWIPLIIFQASKGTVGANIYGPDPLAASSVASVSTIIPPASPVDDASEESRS